MTERAKAKHTAPTQADTPEPPLGLINLMAQIAGRAARKTQQRKEPNESNQL